MTGVPILSYVKTGGGTAFLVPRRTVVGREGAGELLAELNDELSLSGSLFTQLSSSVADSYAVEA